MQRAAAASRAYREGRFEEAAAAYEAMVEAGAGSGDVWFNLGNSHYHAGAKGKAAWAWESALRANPGDEAARQQLETLRAEVQHARVADRTLLEGIGARLDAEVAAHLLLIAWIFGCGILLLRRGLRSGWRRRFTAFLAALALVGAAFGGAGVALAELERRAGWAVVLRPVEARLAPHEGAEVLTRLGETSRVRLLRREGGWVLLRLGEEAAGWVQEEAVAAIGGRGP